MSYSPQPDFWSHFVERYWDQKPAVLKKPFASAVAAPQEIFSAIKTACHRLRGGRPIERLRFYTDGSFLLQDSDAKPYLPNRSDKSVAAYTRRLTRKLSGRPFGLILDDVQVYDAQLWFRLREFLQGLLRRIPTQSASVAIFFGTYEKTPFRIHTDLHSSFLFILGGRKTMYLWPKEYFRDRFDPRLDADFEELRADAIKLEGEPGDVLFWPVTYWHVAEPVGGLAADLSLALTPLQPFQDVLDSLGPGIRELNADPFDVNGFPTTTSEIEDAIKGFSETFKLTVKGLTEASRDSRFEHQLQASWLNRMTCSGWKPIPPPLRWKTLANADVIRGHTEYPILWVAVAGQDIICSAHGRSFTIPADPKIKELLGRLNSGEAQSVKSLIEKYSGVTHSEGVKFTASAEGVRTVLEKLYTMRAITLVNREN